MPVLAENVKRILVLYTGGTIGMVRNEERAFAPLSGIFLSKIRNDHELHDPLDAYSIDIGSKEDNFILPSNGHETSTKILYRVREYHPLLDSTNMSVENWITIARDIANGYDNWDGFVILHGTDTLAYTASALSFMLKGIQKAVILTGAQISIFVSGSDAKNNFIAALRFAASKDIREVCICFAHKLLRGNRAIKQCSEAMEAFSTPNYPILAEVFLDIKINKAVLWDSGDLVPAFSFNLEKEVVILRIYPTMSSKMLQYVLKSPTKGVVLLTYGAGNFPTRPEFMEILSDAIKRGVVIVNITQCMRGAVQPVYATGEVLQKLGVLPGYDMTVEAAFAKLTYVLGQRHLSTAQKEEMMMTNICGELSI